MCKFPEAYDTVAVLSLFSRRVSKELKAGEEEDKSVSGEKRKLQDFSKFNEDKTRTLESIRLKWLEKDRALAMVNPSERELAGRIF